jgi:hypothetical protein
MVLRAREFRARIERRSITTVNSGRGDVKFRRQPVRSSYWGLQPSSSPVFGIAAFHPCWQSV